MQLAAEPLAHYLARTGRLPALQGLALAVQLLSALESFHRSGLAHGGITPDHLFVSRGGRLVVPDPGGQEQAPSRRSVPHAAPGQEGGPWIDHRADLFAAAVVSYELLTGAAPFEVSRGDQDWVSDHQTPPSVRLFREELPLELDAVFQRALARQPDHRYRTAVELSAALQAAMPAPYWTRSPRAAGQRPADSPPPVPAPCVAPPLARPFPQVQTPVRAAAVWHLGVAFAALATVTVIAATLLGGGRPPVPEKHLLLPTEMAMHAGDAPPRQARQDAALVDSPRSAPWPETSVDVAPAPTLPRSPVPVPSDSPAATPQHPRAATGQGQRTPAAAGFHGPASRRDSNGATAAARRARPLRVASASPPDPRASCSRDLAVASELCTAFRCATAEFRQHPTCVRMHAEGAIARAQLAESRGGP